MEFTINTAETLRISDKELSDLLTQVYVEGVFAEPELASSLFEPQSVRARGIIIGAREKQTLNLAGMVIIVPPDSGACRFDLAPLKWTLSSAKQEELRCPKLKVKNTVGIQTNSNVYPCY